MKTVGRILIILAVFALVMGITYAVVNATSSGSPANPPQFDRPFPGDDGNRPQFANGERPDEFRGGDRDEFGGGLGWIFGAVKNIGLVAIIVALIVAPKSWRRKRRRAAQVAG